MKNDFVPEQCEVNSRNLINIKTTIAVNQHRCRVLKLGCVNVRSVRNKNVAATDIFADHCLDVLALTETWHERSSDVCVSSVVPPGDSMVEQARPLPSKAVIADNFVNHGGIACFARDGITLTKIDLPHRPVSFEALCVRLRSRNSPASSV